MAIKQCILAAGVLAAAQVQAGILIENFESYNTGALIPQTSIWSGTSSAWSVVTDPTNPGNKVLQMTGGTVAYHLRYTGAESFIGSGTGYTMFAMIDYHTLGSARRSGLEIDQANANVTAYNCRRLELGGNGTPGFMDVTTGWGTSTGTGGTTADIWNYVRIYRSAMSDTNNEGGSIQVYVSATPFSSVNAGTLVFNKTGRGASSVPDTDPSVSAGKFSLFGLKLYANETLYFDDVAAFSGNVAAIPEPASVGLLFIGVAALLRRRKA